MTMRPLPSVLLSLSLSLAVGGTAGCGDDPEEGESSNDITVCTPLDKRLADRTAGKKALLGASDLEVVADLPYPPGNVAVSADGRVLLSFFPDSNMGSAKVAELVDGKVVPFPNAAFQAKLHTVLGVHVDRQNRFWMLDFGDHGFHRPKIWAVDLATNEVTFEYTFSKSVAPIGSMLNDFQVAPDGKTIYISDTSHVLKKQALVVLNLAGEKPTARRVLQDHVSVDEGDFAVFVGGKKVTTAGIICLEHGVDGLALDHQGSWLSFASLNSGVLYRVRTADLRNTGLSSGVLASRVEKVGPVTMTDGMIYDDGGNVYLTDMEHSAIVRVAEGGKLEVVVKDKRLRWPDGFSWTPDGSLYVTASALNQTLPLAIKTKSNVAQFAPYQIFRLRPQDACAPNQACVGEPGQ